MLSSSRESIIRQYLNRTFLTGLGVGLVVVAIAVAWMFYMQRGAHIEPAGKILKVRTLALDENSSVAIVDFRVTNSSDYAVVVREVDVTLDAPNGSAVDGQTVSEGDARRLFQYYPILGPKYNDSLIIRDRIKPHATLDRMIAARFEMPVAKLDARKRLRLSVVDVDGPSGELIETK
ncbi:MAG TPA: hypothetical protein VK335_16870 [Bryobacteraceae bacterium]|nr:hypothetical protein [Bryobacteraceae bacterium]